MIPKILLLLLVACSLKVLGQNDTINGNQRAFYECSDPLDIDSSKIEIREGEVYFYFKTEESPKNLDSLDFFWLKANPEGYFTAYLVNTSKETFTAKRQDGSLIMIQEALDEEGEWKPIEYWVYSGCGNSYDNPLELDSGKYVIVPIKKYSGEFKTKIRLKFKYGKKIMYSKPFSGSVNLSQFNKEENQVYGILYRGPASYLDKR